MTQIRTIVSEALEAKVRELLPSQAGFTEELQAQNQIVPVIDLTAAAEGSNVPEYLQRAWDFATQLDTIRATTSSVISSTGFWQCGLTCAYDNGGTTTSFVFIDDGVTQKNIWKAASTGAGSGRITINYEFITFLRAGDTLKATAASGDEICIWYRQVATVTGTLVNPLNFTPQ